MADGDSRMAENAAWIFTYADTDVLPSLPPQYVGTWMERAMNTQSETLRRLLLTLISRSVLPHLFRTDFLWTIALSACLLPGIPIASVHFV